MSGSMSNGGSGSGSGSSGEDTPGPGSDLFSITGQTDEFTLSGDASFASTVPGATNGDYIVLPGATGIQDIFDGGAAAASSAAITLSVPESGWYTMDFRYANGSNASGYRNLLVNGEDAPGLVEFDNRYAQDSWGTTRETFPLNAGENRIEINNDISGVSGRLSTADIDVLLDQVTLTQGTSPSDDTSVRSLAMNNTTDMVGFVETARLAADDQSAFGPALQELHYAANWPVSQVDYGAMWFRDVSDGATPRTYAPYFDSTINFDDRGIMTVEYGDYLPTGEALPVSVTEEYAMVPGEPLLVERVTLTNQQETGTEPLQWDVMRAMRLNPELQQRASWDERRQAWIVEIEQGEGEAPLYLATGAFQPTSARGAGEAGENVEAEGRLPFSSLGRDPSTSEGGTGVIGQFEASGEIGGDATSASGEGLTVGVESDSVTLTATRPVELYYYTTLASSLDELDANIANALNPQQTPTSGSPSFWFDRTEEAWADRLEQAFAIPGPGSANALPGTPAEAVEGRTLREVSDPALVTAYQRSLVTILQSQQPEFGSFLASTNPAYEYKVWPRDGAATAISLDGAGMLDDADRYWRWMASVEEDGTGDDAEQFPNGTFYTNYGFYAEDQPIDFVQPEWDAQGLFLIGCYRHHEALIAAGREEDAAAFVNDPTVRQAFVDVANFIADGIGPNGLGPPDFSIWEEYFQYSTFTQATYAAGLNAASRLAEEVGAADSAQRWADGSTTIREAMLRPISADPPGLWNEEAGHFVQGILPSGEVQEKLDASTNMSLVLGVLDPGDPRAISQIDDTIAVLSKNDYGISRYEGDIFYASSPYSPGGSYESLVEEAAWPQMSSYVGMVKTLQDDPDWALNSLNWTVSRYGVGFMPPGEGVDWSTGEPLPSTMAEPVTAGWYMQNLLTYTGQYEPTLPNVSSSGA
ncbi:MAG: glycoside hydrolase family 15 protein [Acetobacteraceae bacterium]